ncbi:MAG TPA: glycine zipper domain-containing protein, partial [Hyphomicrobiaceae bacterium]
MFRSQCALRACIAMAIGAASVWFLEIASAQVASPIVYPARGQSLEQQSADEAACRDWATQQTGVVPYYGAPPPTAAAAPTGGVLRAAARGALLGTVGGAIAGDTGKGAAIGAGVGATAGFMRQNRQRREQAAMEN